MPGWRRNPAGPWVAAAGRSPGGHGSLGSADASGGAGSAGEVHARGAARCVPGGGASGVFRLVQSRRRGRERNRPFAALTPGGQDLFPGRGQPRRLRRHSPFLCPLKNILPARGRPVALPPYYACVPSGAGTHPNPGPAAGDQREGRHAMNLTSSAETITCASPAAAPPPRWRTRSTWTAAARSAPGATRPLRAAPQLVGQDRSPLLTWHGSPGAPSPGEHPAYAAEVAKPGRLPWLERRFAARAGTRPQAGD